jgi:pyrroline-5-carboxylate reductase
MGSERSVSVLGLGVMGSAIARVFVKHGWKTTVWNRDNAKTHALVDVGAVAAPSPAESISASRLVITCLLDPEAFHSVLAGVEPQSCAGRILIDYTSGIPSQIQQSKDIAAKLSFAAYLRGAILTTPAYVGLSESVFYYSGDEKAFKAIENQFNILGQPVYLGADPVSATLQECILVNTFFGLVAGFLQSMAVLKSSKQYTPGGADKLMSEALGPLIAHDYPRLLADLAKQIDSKDYLSSAGNGAPLGLLIRSLQGMLQTHSELGLASIITRPMLELIQIRVAQEGGAEEVSSLVETLSDPKALSKL